MPFWLHDSKINDLTRSLSTIMRLCITLLLLASIFLVWFFLFYSSSQLRVEQQVFTQHNLKKQNHLFKKSLKQFDVVTKKRDDVYQAHEKLLASKPSERAILAFLLKSFRKHSIVCNSIKPVFSKSRTLYKKDYFDVAFSGYFTDLVLLFSFLDNSSYDIKFKKLQCMRGSDNLVHVTTVVRLVDFVKSEE